MSFVAPLAKATVKKVIPKTTKGKVLAAGAAALGYNLSQKDGSKDSKTALTPSQEAQSAPNPPATDSTGKKTLLNLPYGTKIAAGSGWQGIPYAPGTKGTTYATADEVEGNAEAIIAAKTPAERAALLLRLGAIPNLYPTGQAPTSDYVSSMGNRIVWRPSDATALKNILLITDQLGDPSVDVTITNLIGNPNLAAKYFGRVTPATKQVTPGAALSLEFNNKFLDLFNVAPDKADTNSYIKEIQKLEASTGITSAQKEEILLKYVQKQAGTLFATQEGGQTGVAEQGALGNIVRTIRGTYADNGIPVNEKNIYQQAVDSLRSPDAFKNTINGIQQQAALLMPALKDLLAQGKTAKQILSPYLSLRSQILEIPEDQIKMSDMYDVASGDKLMTIQDYKKNLYGSNAYRMTNGFKERSLNDMQALLRAFNIG
mgnify:CR=1 FL=1